MKHLPIAILSVLAGLVRHVVTTDTNTTSGANNAAGDINARISGERNHTVDTRKYTAIANPPRSSLTRSGNYTTDYPTLLPVITTIPEAILTEPWKSLAKMCSPITLPSPMKKCTGRPYYFGSRYKMVVTCPHWAYIPRFNGDALHINVVMHLRDRSTSKWVKIQDFQAARYMNGEKECGYVRDQKTGEVLMDACSTKWYPDTVEMMAKSILEKGVRPAVEALGWLYSSQLKVLYERFVNIKDCMALIKMMALIQA